MSLSLGISLGTSVGLCRILLPNEDGHITVPRQPGQSLDDIATLIARKLQPKPWFDRLDEGYYFTTGADDGSPQLLDMGEPLPEDVRVITMCEADRARAPETNAPSAPSAPSVPSVASVASVPTAGPGGCVGRGCRERHKPCSGYCDAHTIKYGRHTRHGDGRVCVVIWSWWWSWW